MRSLAITTCLLILVSCTTVNVPVGTNAIGFGFYNIRAEAADAPFLNERELLGLEIGNGFTLGYAAHSTFQADPTVCQIVIVISSEADLAFTQQSLLNHFGSEVCLIKQG